MSKARVVLEFELPDTEGYSKAQLEQEISTHTFLALIQHHNHRALRAVSQGAKHQGSAQGGSWKLIEVVHTTWADVLSQALCSVEVDHTDEPNGE